MTKIHIAAVLGALLAPAAGQDEAPPAKAPQHLLRLSIARDVPAWWRVRQDMVASTGVSGASKVRHLRLEMFWKSAIRRADGDAAVVVFTLARFRGAVRDDQGDASFFDSATDSSAPAGLSELVDLAGTEIAATTDGRGRVRKLDLPESLQTLDRSSGIAYLKTSDVLRPFDLELPELPVAVGARWRGSNERKLAANDELAFESEYELLGVEKGKARIQQRLVVKSATEEKKGEGAARAGELRGRRTFTLDLGSGRLVRVEGETTIEARPGAGVDLKLTLRRSSEPTVEPGELEPLDPPPAGEEKK